MASHSQNTVDTLSEDTIVGFGSFSAASQVFLLLRYFCKMFTSSVLTLRNCLRHLGPVVRAKLDFTLWSTLYVIYNPVVSFDRRYQSGICRALPTGSPIVLLVFTVAKELSCRFLLAKSGEVAYWW